MRSSLLQVNVIKDKWQEVGDPSTTTLTFCFIIHEMAQKWDVIPVKVSGSLMTILSVFLMARYVSKILFYILFHHHICTLFFRYVTGFNFPLRNLSGVHVYTYILYWVCPCIHDRMTTRIVYSREFLLSFGELEHSKKLPPDFDTPLLRSFRIVFYCLGLFPSDQWDFCLMIFVF